METLTDTEGRQCISFYKTYSALKEGVIYNNSKTRRQNVVSTISSFVIISIHSIHSSD